MLHAQENIEISEENLIIAKELHEKTKKQLELGLVANVDVTSSELNYEKAADIVFVSSFTILLRQIL